MVKLINAISRESLNFPYIAWKWWNSTLRLVFHIGRVKLYYEKIFPLMGIEPTQASRLPRSVHKIVSILFLGGRWNYEYYCISTNKQTIKNIEAVVAQEQKGVIVTRSWVRSPFEGTNYYFLIFLFLRFDIRVKSPALISTGEFRRWGTKCFNTMFYLPTLLRDTAWNWFYR